MANKEQSLLIAQMTDIHIGFDREGGDEEAKLSAFAKPSRICCTNPSFPTC